MEKTILIKLGTQVISRADGTLDNDRIAALVGEISQLRGKEISVILVSSGASTAGTPSVKIRDYESEISRRQILSSIGQISLMQAYATAFKKHDIVCAQILVTKEDFRSRQHYLSMRRCFENLLSYGVVPVVNENDVVGVNELMFTDNDELAGLVASMMDIDSLIILTGVDGLYIDLKTKKVLNKIIIGKTPWRSYIVAARSPVGRGGMITKCEIGEKLARLGIETIIANGAKPNILLSLINNKSIAATRFIPNKRTSTVKKWIAHSKGQEQGRIYINEGAVAILTSTNRIASLLPVGVVRIQGKFMKGDIVDIRNKKGEQIGLGRAQYGSDKAKELIGKKGQRPLVHYDYLHLEI